MFESDVMGDQLPRELLSGATLREQEYGWKPESFPSALAKAERLGLACVAGQFQFRVGLEIYEPYWMSADSSEHRSDEPWRDYVHRSCCEVLESFQKSLQTTDLRAVAANWPELEAKTNARFDLLNNLVFVAYFVTEQEYSSMTHPRER